MTRRVIADSAAWSGVRMMESAPVSRFPVYRPSRRTPPGCGPRGFGSLVRPLPFSTKNRVPSAANMTDVGYQPTGTHPSTLLAPGFVTSTTATVLLSALATSSFVPSGDSARLFGVVPTGALGYNATEICSLADREARSTTHTAFVFAQATNSRLPSLDCIIALG